MSFQRVEALILRKSSPFFLEASLLPACCGKYWWTRRPWRWCRSCLPIWTRRGRICSSYAPWRRELRACLAGSRSVACPFKIWYNGLTVMQNNRDRWRSKNIMIILTHWATLVPARRASSWICPFAFPLHDLAHLSPFCCCYRVASREMSFPV
jgi:hypothetical protein